MITERRPLRSRLVAECLGTSVLVAAIIGSGIAASQISHDQGFVLLQNAFATAGVLTALILALAPVSGAHFNPAVTLAGRLMGEIDSSTAAAYVAAQIVGAIGGALGANALFGRAVLQWAQTDRGGWRLGFSEVVATVGLLVVIFGVSRAAPGPSVAFAVGAYVTGVFYFTPSTGFANPAVTVGRSLSDTFAGIDIADVVGFIAAQLVGATVAVGLIRAMAIGRPANAN